MDLHIQQTTKYLVEAFNIGEVDTSRPDINEYLDTFTPDWDDSFENLVPNVGLDEYLDKFWKGSTYTAAFYVGLTDGTPTEAAGDTMASHAGWVEVVDYDEATREVLTLGSVASQSVSNTASKAVFTMNATVTVGGAFITTNSTKSGTTGILMSVGDFTEGDKPANSGTIIRVTATISATSA